MSAADEGRQAAEFCAELVRGHDFSRYASTLFVPAGQRRALLAIYAFNVEISRVREVVSQPLPGEIRLQWWSDMLAGEGHGGVEGNPVAAELNLAIENFGLPAERLSRLVNEHQFDLYNDPMPTMAALEGYLQDTNSALFSLGAAAAGWQSPDIEHLARHAGLAQGMAQAVVALPLDAARRQLFGEPRQRHGRGVCGQGNPKTAGGAQSTAERGPCASGHRPEAAAGRRARGEVNLPAAGRGGPRA
jgi:phytoene synthase